VIILGVDPGLSGALAWLNDGELIEAVDMPVVAGSVNAPAFSEWLDEHSYLRPDMAVVEKVHSMPGQGVASTFKFGASYGCVLGILGVSGIRVEHVTPNQWKKHFNLIGKEKDESRKFALDRWPTQSGLFSRKKDHGRADAALIGLWGHSVVGT
jgi:crossover junction endodeoxyribonuclease RuvC